MNHAMAYTVGLCRKNSMKLKTIVGIASDESPIRYTMVDIGWFFSPDAEHNG